MLLVICGSGDCLVIVILCKNRVCTEKAARVGGFLLYAENRFVSCSSCSDFYDGGFIEEFFAVQVDVFAVLRERLFSVGFDGGDVAGVTVGVQGGEVAFLERLAGFGVEKFAGFSDSVFARFIKHGLAFLLVLFR